ncbi:MAG: redoxin domain-containing protein [Thermoplasmata archaeon]
MQEMVVKVGRAIPDFEVETYHEDQIKRVNLSDYRGKWLILAFYPADFTFVCPTELEELANYYPKFQELEAEILSVSTDTVYVHKAWHDTSPAVGKIEYPMVADPSGAVSKAFGTYLEDQGISLRATFIVDPEGVLKAYEIHDNSIGRSAGEILRKVQASKYVQEHPGEVCPASWRPGEKTLKTGLDLVGKI